MADVSDQVLHILRERVKELTALHRTARLLQNHSCSDTDLLREIVSFLPEAWQYPEITEARVCFRDLNIATSQFRLTPWVQRATFRTSGGETGSLEICYTEPRPAAAEGPFLKEERDLIESLAEMLRSHFQHRLADEALVGARAALEEQVKERTAQLEQVNAALRTQIEEQRQSALRIEQYQRQLRRLALELSLAEARERREIAGDLHDHIGQALAFIKLRVSQFQSNAVFCGFEDNIDEILTLLDRTISYTRGLTLQISPPVLYEFGLAAALEWMAEQFQQEHQIRIQADCGAFQGSARGDNAAVLFRAAKELLTNAVRHAGSTHVLITLSGSEELAHLSVQDDGRGFDLEDWQANIVQSGKYGLFSVGERIQLLGGSMEITTAPGKGTKVLLVASLAPKVT